MNYKLSIIQYPSGKYGFVGSVPYNLAYFGTFDEIEKQMMLPSKYRTIKAKVYNSEQEAKDEAKLLGYEI